MAFNPDEYLNEEGSPSTATAEFDPDAYLSELDSEEEAEFDPDAYLEEVERPVGTSFVEEVRQIPQALVQAAGQPLEMMGETAEVLGAPRVGAALRGAITEPEGYIPAAQRFMEPQEGEFQIGGFAPQFLPRAAIEQAGQLAGAIATSAIGRTVGGLVGAVGGPVGKVAGATVGQFLGPALFEMSQLVGPVARERAANQGREEPTTDDLAWAWSTAAGSGALNAIGARYLPNGDKLAASFGRRIAESIAGESTTEGLQSVVQQTGQTFLTERGLDINPKEAIGEALIAGPAAAGATVIAEPFRAREVTPEAKAEAAAETQVAAQSAVDIAPATADVVSQQAATVIEEAKGEEISIPATVTPRQEGETDEQWRTRIEQERAETPEQRLARLQEEAAAGADISLEEEGDAGLPPATVTPPVEPAATPPVAPVEPVVEPVVAEPQPEPVTPAAPEVIAETVSPQAVIPETEPADVPDTRGQGKQFHGARGPIEGLTEGYYSSDNIYGGESTFYTTDAVDIAAGYQRKKPNSVVYQVSEKAPVNFFNMEERRPAAEWEQMFAPTEATGIPSEGFIPFGIELAAEKANGNPNLREVMDEMRAESANEGYSRDTLQEFFAGMTGTLERMGFGGMQHIGGLKTNRPEHTVKIYFKPSEQLDLQPVDVRGNPVTPVAPTPEGVTPTPETPNLEPLRRVARAEQAPEDIPSLVDAGLVEVYKDQPVLTDAGLAALPEGERPRLTPEARKIQIDTRTSEPVAEAISKNLRIGIDQVPFDVRMPEGWTIEGDIYVPPAPQEVAPAPAAEEPNRINAFLESAPTEGLTYFRPSTEQALRWEGGIYPTISNESGTVKIALDRTDIFERKNGEVWRGDPTAPPPNTYIIQAVVTSPESRGVGEASAVMQRVINMADKSGLTLKLEPVPMKSFVKRGQKAMTKKQLVDWYKRLGFKQAKEGSDAILIREPAAPAPEVEARESRREQPVVLKNRFYSQLERTVVAKMPNVSSPEQLKAIIDPSRGSGVKPEEVKWSGITEAIDRIAAENNGRVPKEAIIQYMRDEGRVRFEEKTMAAEDTKELEDLYFERGLLRERKKDTSELDTKIAELEKAVGNTKYEQWQIGGGTNYREVILTVPNDEYTSPKHFEDVKGYVAHMRLNERKDSEGNDGLFIEEIQSDRHQQAREIGYDTGARNQKLFEAAKEFYFSIWSPYQTGQISGKDANEAFDELSKRSGFSKAEIQDEGARRKDFTDQYVEKGVPDAPFRKDWPLQMFKRALEEAVASGKNWIGWTVGETQADRYDLSKQIDSVSTIRHVDGGRFIDVRKDGYEVYDAKYDSNGVITGSSDESTIGKNISEVIGKDLAEKVLKVPDNAPPKDFRGLDLKVGGEGMAGFYDNILPKEIAKYVKKWGATVEKGDVFGATIDGRGYEIVSPQGESVMLGSDAGELRAMAAEEFGRGYKVRAVKGRTPIWRVNITPEMRRIIEEEGQPLFSLQMPSKVAGLAPEVVTARLETLGFGRGGLISVVNEPDASFEGRTIIRNGKVVAVELNAAALKDEAAIDRVLNHEFAESANADGALNRLVAGLTPKERKEINDAITRLGYAEKARTAEEAARAIETLAESWKGRGFFDRAVARIEAWGNKLGLKLTRRAAEYIAARNLSEINAEFRETYNKFIDVRGEAREARVGEQAVVDADMGRRSQTELTPQEIEQLESGEKIRLYRAMQVIDGKLYPPMSALVGGKLRKPTEIGSWEKAEERPDLLDKRGKFILQKGNKATVPAAYNPYFHTSSSPLNDQFSSAYKRDNLVTVEVEVPASELTSGYRAEGAKDAVGEVRWNAGPVSSKLPADKKRRVVLSRYTKVVRIVPDSEVADIIASTLEGTNLSIPENTVTPSLRSELENKGVTITPRPTRGEEVRESRREDAIPTFSEGSPESSTLSTMAASMAKVDAASEAKPNPESKPTFKISEIASVWMDQGGDTRQLQDMVTEYTNLSPANAKKVANAIAKQYQTQQAIAETGAVIAEPAPEVEGAPRKTSVQRLIEQAVGVRRPIVKLEVNEKTALKDQIRLKAREARETRKARKEAARDLAESITQYVKDTQIRGPIRSRQALSLAKQALKLDVNNEKAVDRYAMYVGRVIENANYDKDLSDAKALRKRAKQMAKNKNIGPEQAKVLQAIGNINPSLLDNPFEYNVLTERYLLGFLPVTSQRYSVMPDAEARQYLESLEEQMTRNQAELDRGELERFFESQAGFAQQRGLTMEEAQSLLNEDGDIAQIIQDYDLEKRKATEEMLLNLAQNAQKTLKTYDDTANTARQKELISFMQKVRLESITSDEKKRFIRFANNILANGETFGVEQFEAVAKAQERLVEASKDKRLTQRMNAWIGPLSGGTPAEMVQKLSLITQSEADTLKNIFGREAVGVFRRVLGLLDLDVAQTASTTAKEKVANKVGEFYRNLKKKYGEAAVNLETKTYATAAGYFIQAEGNKTQEESIAYRRRLWTENIEELRKSQRRQDREEAERKQAALNALTGNSNAEILNNLKAVNPAAYEQLMWWKDQMHPEHKPFLKDHVENFRNQANNYDNVDHLSIHYKWDQSPEIPSDLETQEFDDPVSFRIKQAANSIKRKEHPSLPVNPDTGDKANIDVNFGYNQYNALTEQLERAYTSPAWEAVYAFTRDPLFNQVVGGKANADFVKNILRNIKATRTRKAMLDDENQIIGGTVALARRVSTQATLGGFTQPLRQVPDQLIKLIFTTGRIDLITQNFLNTGNADPLFNKLPISRRGDARAGSQFAAEFNEQARKVEASVTNKQWTKYKELMTQMGELWMTPLRASDVWIAKVSWMTYYEAELNKRDIKMESWERESELFETDPARQEAAAQAEYLVDFYAGASDPTKMAALSKQGNNGWREFAKLIFLSLNSFALQQKSALISDARDLMLRTGDRKAALAGIAGIVGGMIAFHGMRIFIIGGLVYPAAMMVLKGIFGIDMDEPDEEEQDKQLKDNWRKMKASIYSNIVAGGAGQFLEGKSIDAFNRTMYLWDAHINPDEMMDDKGEFISFSKYEKEKSPFYRFRSYEKSEFTFGLADVLSEQAERSVTQTAQLLNDEEMSIYTGNEQAYAYFATGVEWAYFFRFMDTDLKRITTKLKNDIDKQAKEREAEIRKIRSGR